MNLSKSPRSMANLNRIISLSNMSSLTCSMVGTLQIGGEYHFGAPNRCFILCKDTKLKANHNAHGFRRFLISKIFHIFFIKMFAY
jgi:hypothetical protein